ncbi:CLUMA_CG004757, isoform A [Clunio marinus]|uniref:CLUMA_CG004757, isoform A n=1 Tax=Clunio marinus TaxID=568069 RepID=A0A1J1HSU0_9DIPT|nr:CLUMA_CG004757, isoform A [Clunio marinus]
MLPKEHAPKILRELNNTLNAFTAVNPKYAFNSNLRMITFAAESKIKNCDPASGFFSCPHLLRLNL